ncbi:MAG TPA: TetR/AcrR family transcriptional regulator [Friedmanniella sp.]
MGDSVVGLRERTRRAVQHELLLVALDLFATQGFESTTVDQIASAAGLSRRSFFRYFGTKEDVLTQTLAELGQQLAVDLRVRPASEVPWVALRRAFDPLVELMSSDARALTMTRLMLDTPALQASHLQKVTSWQRALAEVLERRLDVGPDEHDRRLEADAVSGAAVGCLMAAQEAWVRADGARPLAELVDATMNAVGRAAYAADASGASGALGMSGHAQAATRDRP